MTDVKILSTGLAAGIIVDATIIRGILAPALVALLGRFNWWLPAPVARLLRVALLIPHPGIDRRYANWAAVREPARRASRTGAGQGRRS